MPRKNSLRYHPFIKLSLLFLILLLITSFIPHVLVWYQYRNTIPVGLNIELSGSLKAVGISSKNAASLIVDTVNSQGGLLVEGKRYPVRLLVEDNGSNTEQAKQAAEKLINDGVIALIGPNASKYAISASDIAEDARVLMISPWSTDPKTTTTSQGYSKKYVFRAAFTDSFQGKALASFATKDLKAKKAVIIYDRSSDMLKQQADFFDQVFVANGGAVGVIETFVRGDSDFSKQLGRIKSYKPDVIFLPAYSSDAWKIIRQAKMLKIITPFLGSDAWGSGEILTLCGSYCEGAYVSAHYAPDSKSPITQEFVEKYQKKYQSVPDDVAALTYDSFGLLFQAIQKAGTIHNANEIREALAHTYTYHGVTGDMRFIQGSTDPIKSAVVLQIQKKGFRFVTNINP